MSDEIIRFTEHLITGRYGYPFAVAAADLDNDGKLDLVSPDAHRGLYWLENDGRGAFTRHVIQSGESERLERHVVCDMNGDGLLDIVIVDNITDSVLWFENNSNPADGTPWQYHFITEGGLPGAYDVAVADFEAFLH